MDTVLARIFNDGPKWMSKHMFPGLLLTLTPGALYYYIFMTIDTNFFILLIQMFLFTTFLFLVDAYNSGYIINKYRDKLDDNKQDISFKLRLISVTFILVLIITTIMTSAHLIWFKHLPTLPYAVGIALVFIIGTRISYIRQAEKIINRR